MACPKINFLTDTKNVSNEYVTKSPNTQTPTDVISTGMLIAAIQKLLVTFKDNNYKTNLIENEQMQQRYNFGLNSAKLQGNAILMQSLASGIMGPILIGGAVIGIACSLASFAVAAKQGVELAEISKNVVKQAPPIEAEGSARLEGAASEGAGASEARSTTESVNVEGQERKQVTANSDNKKERIDLVNQKYGKYTQTLNTIAQSSSGGSQGAATQANTSYQASQSVQQSAGGVADTQKQTMDSQQKATNSTEQAQQQSVQSNTQSVQTILNTIVSSSQGTR